MRLILAWPEAFLGPNVTSDEDVLETLMRSASSIDPAAATCAMGKSNDPDAVVDSQARGFGVQGLRMTY